MKKDTLITKQQLELEELRLDRQVTRQKIKILIGYFISIGQPLNDNMLEFNAKQLAWCQNVFNLIEELK